MRGPPASRALADIHSAALAVGLRRGGSRAIPALIPCSAPGEPSQSYRHIGLTVT